MFKDPRITDLLIDTAKRRGEKHGAPEEQERKAWENFRRIKPGGKITIRRPTRTHAPNPSTS
jgi:hypothetical protein